MIIASTLQNVVVVELLILSALIMELIYLCIIPYVHFARKE